MTSCHHVPFTSVRTAALQYAKTSHYHHNQKQSQTSRLSYLPKTSSRYFSSNFSISTLGAAPRDKEKVHLNPLSYNNISFETGNSVRRESQRELHSGTPILSLSTNFINKDSTVAPPFFRNSSADLHASSSIGQNGNVNFSAGHGRENNWRTDLCGATASYYCSKCNSACASRSGVYSNNCNLHFCKHGKCRFDQLTTVTSVPWNVNSLSLRKNKDFLESRRAMPMSFLLDPIIGSPPSSLTSPIAEARDDISALSDGFTRKVKLLRRRLSTSFDEPTYRQYGSTSPVPTGVGVAVEHEGPFAFRSSSESKKDDSTDAVMDDQSSKRIQLNAWLAKIHEEALAKTRENSPGSPSRKGSGDSQDRGDNDGNSHNQSSPVHRISEDLFQLLVKVIGFKGRNISHITVEQSVKDLCTVYLDANDDDKLTFFTELAEKYGVDHEYVTVAATNLASCKDSDVRLTLEEKLRAALVPKSQWLFTQIGRLENGVKFLVDMRTDLLDATEKAQGKSSLKALNNSLRDLIGMWFNVGFLNLERVTWQSSCDMLQKISEYEAVHPMRNWTDLKKRVGPNRRCFVFTHNSMPSEPVVVLHTYLTDHIPSSIQKIVASHKMRMMSLDSDLPLTSTKEDPDFINTAVFYSITSTQRGLTGIELGNYLIKRVVRELQSEFPKMTQYSSLSPIPGFKNWLVSSIKNEMKDPINARQKLLTDVEIETLKPIFMTYSSEKDFYEVFLDLLKVNSWFSDEKLVRELEKPLMRLCAQYLYVVKRRGYALDPVGHFHLRNGAVLWRLNWLGDNSPRGLGQSCGIMVNYRYFLEACEGNSQNYMENQVIQISDQVNHLVKLTD